MMMRTTRTLHRARPIAALMLAGALAPAPLAAQGPTSTAQPTETQEHIDGPTYARVALGFTQIYDDNIFVVAKSQHPQSDLVSRFGPTFEVGRRSRRLDLTAKYGLAAERYFERIDLNTDLAYQDGGFRIRYNTTPRTEYAFEAQYVDTQTAQDLNLMTGIAAGRGRAERLLARGRVGHDVTRITNLNASYEASNDTFVETNTNLRQEAKLGLAWTASRRTSYRLDVRARYVTFNYERQNEFGLKFRDLGAQNSQVLTGGVTYAFTPLTTVEVDGGPRLTAGDWTPEFAGTIRRRTQKGEISAGYSSSQDTAIGEPGLLDVKRVFARLLVTPVRALTMSATPAFAKSQGLGQSLGRSTDVRELDVDITIQVLRRWSFGAAARVSDQSIELNGVDDPIESRRLWLTTTVTLP
jgi:hypothetical protein